MAVKKLLLMGIEAVEDTAEVLVAADIIDTVDLNITRYGGPRVSKNVDRHLVGNQEEINPSPFASATFGCYATAGGAAGDIAPYDVPLRACGFAAVNTPATDTTYTFADSGFESATIFDYADDIGQLQKITGVRGSVAFKMANGELPLFQFSDYIGTFVAPEAGSAPGGLDWSTWDQPVLPMTETNTPTLTIDGFAAGCSSFEIDWGVKISRLDLPNYRASKLTDREPSASFTILAPTFAAKNFWATLASHDGITKVPVALEQGVTAGQIVGISAAELQLSNIEETEVEGTLAYTMTGKFIDVPVIVIK